MQEWIEVPDCRFYRRNRPKFYERLEKIISFFMRYLPDSERRADLYTRPYSPSNGIRFDIAGNYWFLQFGLKDAKSSLSLLDDFRVLRWGPSGPLLDGKIAEDREIGSELSVDTWDSAVLLHHGADLRALLRPVSTIGEALALTKAATAAGSTAEQILLGDQVPEELDSCLWAISPRLARGRRAADSLSSFTSDSIDARQEYLEEIGAQIPGLRFLRRGPDGQDFHCFAQGTHLSATPYEGPEWPDGKWRVLEEDGRPGTREGLFGDPPLNDPDTVWLGSISPDGLGEFPFRLRRCLLEMVGRLRAEFGRTVHVNDIFLLEISDLLGPKSELLAGISFADEPQATASSGVGDGSPSHALLASSFTTGKASLPAERPATEILTVPTQALDHILAAFLAKGFLILTGVSGTGKSQLARALAHALAGTRWRPRGEPDGNAITDGWTALARAGFEPEEPSRLVRYPRVETRSSAVGRQDEDCWAFLPVRPDWTSSEHIWGHVNPLTEPPSFQATAALHLLVHAAEQEPRRRHILVLDEMNLSRVEYYLSDLLSLMESPGELVHIHDAGRPIPACVDDDGGEEATGTMNLQVKPSYPWPQNLMVIGTVNVDETTFAFSPKVLDRAFVFEFTDVDFSALKDVAEDIRHWCTRLCEVLRPANLHFGYRTVKEMDRWLSIRGAELDEESEAALLLSKVLPKLRGSEDVLRPVLLDLLGVLLPDLAALERDGRAQLSAKEAVAQLGVDSPCVRDQAARRIVDMLARLDATGYASFF